MTTHHPPPHRARTLLPLLGGLLAILQCLPDGRCQIFVSSSSPFAALNQFLAPLIPWTIGIAAGVAVLMVVFGGIEIILSAGEQESFLGGIGRGKERIKAAIIGLLLLVFSATLLNILNADYFWLS